MGEVVLQLVVEIIFESIPRYFGALLRWIFLRFRISFSKVLAKKGNTTIGCVALGMIILLFLILFNL